MELLQLAAQVPGSAEAHQRLGKVVQLQGRLNEAETCFRRRCQLDPDYVGALIGLGTIEAAKGDPQSALKRFQLAVEIEPHDAEAHFACAEQLEAMGRSDEALAAYFRTLRVQSVAPRGRPAPSAPSPARAEPAGSGTRAARPGRGPGSRER